MISDPLGIDGSAHSGAMVFHLRRGPFIFIIPVDCIMQAGMIGHRKGKLMQKIWIIEVVDPSWNYFAGWEKENDPDMTSLRLRAIEYTDECEATEDADKLTELGFYSEVSRGERFVR